MVEKHYLIPQGVAAIFRFGVSGVAVNVTGNFANPSSVAVNPALAEQVFASIKSLWNTQLAPLCPASTTFNGVWLRDINTVGNALQQSTGAAAPGTAAAGEQLPRQIAACLTVRTAKAGKSFRGRMYWCGFAESSNGSDNHMGTATKTALDAFATGFLTAVNVGGLTFGVGHRPTAFDPATGLPISPGLGFITPAQTVVCRDNIWDTQRRRAA